MFEMFAHAGSMLAQNGQMLRQCFAHALAMLCKSSDHVKCGFCAMFCKCSVHLLPIFRSCPVDVPPVASDMFLRLSIFVMVPAPVNFPSDFHPCGAPAPQVFCQCSAWFPCSAICRPSSINVLWDFHMASAPPAFSQMFRPCSAWLFCPCSGQPPNATSNAALNPNVNLNTNRHKQNQT